MLKSCCQFAFTPYKRKNNPQTVFYKAKPEVPISQITAYLMQKSELQTEFKAASNILKILSILLKTWKVIKPFRTQTIHPKLHPPSQSVEFYDII